MEYESFPEVVDREDEKEMYIVDKLVEEIWAEFDVDGNGILTKDETRMFIKKMCQSSGRRFKE